MIDENGEEIYKTKDILEAQRRYYKNLYDETIEVDDTPISDLIGNNEKNILGTVLKKKPEWKNQEVSQSNDAAFYLNQEKQKTFRKKDRNKAIISYCFNNELRHETTYLRDVLPGPTDNWAGTATKKWLEA